MRIDSVLVTEVLKFKVLKSSVRVCDMGALKGGGGYICTKTGDPEPSKFFCQNFDCLI